MQDNRQIKADQILDQVKSWIRSGEISIGDKLPSERALGRQFGVSVPTINKAMARLEDLGIVTRTAGRGTHVTNMPPLDAIAVICDLVHFRGDAPLHAADPVMEGLEQAAEAQSLTSHFLIGRGNTTEQFIHSLGAMSGIWNAIQGVVAWGWRPGMEDWFTSKGIHLVTISSEDQGKHQILFDYRKLGSMAADFLATRCEKGIAIIQNEGMGHNPWNNPLPHFDKRLRERGYQGPCPFASGKPGQMSGYRAGERLASQLNTCDGVFITNDLMASGFCEWLSDHPNCLSPDAVIITHANRGLTFNIPDHVVKLEFDLRNLCAQAINHLSDLIYGRTHDEKTRIWIEPDLIRNRKNP